MFVAFVLFMAQFMKLSEATGGWAVSGYHDEATCGVGSSLLLASGSRLDNCHYNGIDYVMFTCENGKRKPFLRILSFLFTTKILFYNVGVTPKTGYYSDAGCTILKNQDNYGDTTCTQTTWGSSVVYAKSFCSSSPETGFVSSVNVLM
jgi:hypothetical protein